MNLIDDCWLPVVRADGSKTLIAPWQIADEENPVIDLDAPRADFQGALYQFLIGLLQTSFAPEDMDEWLEYWHSPPPVDRLKKNFSKFSTAFILDNSDGPAFMQDFDLPECIQKPVGALLIETPGEKTCKDNADHFIKRESVGALCYPCAANALFTLQINAPKGGNGHRVGLRGGGPLTSLVLPEGAVTLWHKLWSNVLTEDTLTEKLVVPEASSLPWLAATRCSNEGLSTFPKDVHLLQQYWSMPRRIRLDFKVGNPLNCSICDTNTSQYVESYQTKNNGTNYDGPWVHSLTPYRFDPKKKNLPLSLKGQQGGLGYRHWLGLVWQDTEHGEQAAANVRQFNEEICDLIDEETAARLWCFGFDVDNMKARCWYEHTLPILHISKTQQRLFLDNTSRLLDSARQGASLLRGQLKEAWFKRPGDIKGDMSTIVQAFWEQTQGEFYRQLYYLAKLPEGQRQMPSKVAQQWHMTLKNTVLKLFDEYVLSASPEDINMKQVVQARNKLGALLYKSKAFKLLLQIAQTDKEISQ